MRKLWDFHKCASWDSIPEFTGSVTGDPLVLWVIYIEGSGQGENREYVVGWYGDE